LLVSLYESATGTPRGSLTIPSFKVSPSPPTRSLAIWRDVAFGDTLLLASRDPLPEAAAPGDSLTLRAQWQAQKPVSSILTTFLHLVAPDGTLAAQTDFAPDYPPTLWGPGEVVELSYTLTIPDTLAPGAYELRLGWYDSATLERIPARSEEAVDEALRLGNVER
ncbi:MAG: hypothetical protein ACRDIB_15175, partial [Ardenticatenaceae bacterium]